ncbi:hypothetical protein C8R45DRAFT_1098958 [Mycena sanguinolenta]|nr:hypothetical protein C8R45DRAFT_1098958 [Mycena sanguinolenta]
MSLDWKRVLRDARRTKSARCANSSISGSDWIRHGDGLDAAAPLCICVLCVTRLPPIVDAGLFPSFRFVDPRRHLPAPLVLHLVVPPSDSTRPESSFGKPRLFQI